MASEINPFGSIATMFEQFKMPGVINPFGNMATMLEQFRMPGVDMASMVEAQRKNVEALVEANRLAYQGMQAMVQKQTEMFTRAMQASAAASKGADPTRQAEIARRACVTIEETLVATDPFSRTLPACHSDSRRHVAMPRSWAGSSRFPWAGSAA